MSDHLHGIAPLQQQLVERGVCSVAYRLNGRQVLCGEALSSRHEHHGTFHDYASTACVHDQHSECRRICKFCMSTCRCDCHADR